MSKSAYIYDGWLEGETGFVTGQFHIKCLNEQGVDYEVEEDDPAGKSEYCDICGPGGIDNQRAHGHVI